MNNKALGKHLKSAREKQNISVKKLAAMTKLTVDTIRALESGKRPPGIETLIVLCNALKVSPDYLLSAEVDKTLVNRQKKSPALFDSVFRLTNSEKMRIEDIARILSKRR